MFWRGAPTASSGTALQHLSLIKQDDDPSAAGGRSLDAFRLIDPSDAFDRSSKTTAASEEPPAPDLGRRKPPLILAIAIGCAEERHIGGVLHFGQPFFPSARR